MVFRTGKAEINVTPLIDVLLVLIIIFMVIVPVAPTGEEAAIPQDSAKSAEAPVNPIVIELHANGTDRASLSINHEPVTWENLPSRLIDIYKLRAERVTFVRADTDMEFQQVADVIDMAHAAGVQNVGLMK